MPQVVCICLLLGDLWPQCHKCINHHEPEGDQRNKIVELVRPIHHYTEDHHQEVQAEQDLSNPIESIVPLQPEEGEVPIARLKQISSDQDPDVHVHR